MNGRLGKGASTCARELADVRARVDDGFEFDVLIPKLIDDQKRRQRSWLVLEQSLPSSLGREDAKQFGNAVQQGDFPVDQTLSFGFSRGA